MEPLNNSPIPSTTTGQPPMGMPQQMATPEQKKELEMLIEKTRGNLAGLNTAKIQTTNESERARVEALREIFKMFQLNGVDLEDPEAINAFIEEIRKKNPEMAKMLEDALGSLLTGEEQPIEQQEPMEMPGMPNMDQQEGGGMIGQQEMPIPQNNLQERG